ncbi:MAG: GNAT family N-acetyltransferase [Oligoflexia bacterium]|nr:GNAT family N-acetyltransferase [Oligoflexia bacterium]
MATIAPRKLTLADGAALLIRVPERTDHSRLTELDRAGASEPELTGQLPGDPVLSDSERLHWIMRMRDGGSALALLAELEGRLVGFLECRAQDYPRGASHVARFMICLERDFRDRGIGRHLVETLLDWAAAHPTLEKVSLGVLAGNARALALYRKLGFTEEGRRAREFRSADGAYLDTVMMGRFVK